MWAAPRGHLECVRLLLEAKADPNYADRDGDNALTSFELGNRMSAAEGNPPDPAKSGPIYGGAVGGGNAGEAPTRR
eukprot:7388482-Prymnesium_polylepis.1